MNFRITVCIQANELISGKSFKNNHQNDVSVIPPPQPLPPDSPGFGVIGVADAATKVRGGVRIRKELSLCLS